METGTQRETFLGHNETGKCWGHIEMGTYRGGDICRYVIVCKA